MNGARAFRDLSRAQPSLQAREATVRLVLVPRFSSREAFDKDVLCMEINYLLQQESAWSGLVCHMGGWSLMEGPQFLFQGLPIVL